MAIKKLSQYGRGIRFTIAIVLAAMVATSTARSQAAAPQLPSDASQFTPSALQEGQCLAFGTARSTRDLRTGAMRFIGTEPGRPIPPPFGARADATPESAARAFLSVCGSLFALGDHSSELMVERTMTLADRRSAVRFQQVYRGIPIVGGELIVNLDEHQNLLATTARILAHPGVQTTPVVTAASASATALAAIAKVHGVAPEDLSATPPALSIYSPTLIGPDAGSPTLVWRTEVTPHEPLPIRELVLVDATRGSIALHFNQAETALQRQTFTAGNGSSLPGTLVCDESNPACAGGDSHAVSAHVYAGDTYAFYAANHGRDSINNAGLIIKSTVHYGSGYVNAFWNGTQMVYGDGAGFPLADDVVGHELTHGVTQYTSNLFYYYQSGAINESFSDVWGEFIDQTNGRGNDTDAVKWLLGEDITGIGAIRSMKDPTVFGDPDRMMSPLYFRGMDDNGGVHYNSGVNNKAAYLMVDGGTFNGQTINGLGITKVAKIYYEAQTHLLTSGADYADLFDALNQGCSNLVGTAGIVVSDCDQVRKATLAVEMNQQPVPGFNPEAPLCAAGQTPSSVFFDNLENGSVNFTTITNVGTNRWSFGSPYGPYAHSGTNFLYADDYPAAITDTSIAMVPNITVPANAYLHFAHAYGFEANFDGGIVEYTTNNGASWTDAGPLFDYNGYTNTPLNIETNPLFGHLAFTGDSHGYISSRANLSLLAGQNVRFRWRMGLDSSGYDWGWWLDDVRIYRCVPLVPQPPTISSISNQTTLEDVAKAVSFTVGDPDTPLTSLTLTGTSSNQAIVPNGSIAFGGSGAARTVTLTPAANQSGTTTIAITVSDGSLTASTSFALTVSAVNDAPVISTIGAQPLDQDTVVGPLAFTVGDIDNPVDSLTVSGTSSNQTVIPNGNIHVYFGASSADRTVTLTPAAGQVGTTTITLTVSDGSLTATTAFLVTSDLLISDTFTGSNGTALSAHPPDINTPGAAWAITGGTPAPTLTNGMVGVTVGSGHLQATLNSGLADIIMGADYRAGSGAQLGGLAFRLTDANNHLVLLAYGNALQLYRKQNGTYTLLASQPIAAVAAGSVHRIEVRTNGSAVQGWWDNALVMTVTETFQQTATRHGLDWNSAYDPTVRYDNFLIRNGLGTRPGTPAAPGPPNGVTGVPTNATLTWSATNATSYSISFGTTNPPPASTEILTSASYTPALSATTSYFWQVVARNAAGWTTGPMWSFTTGTAPVVPADLVISDTFTGANGTLLSSHVPEVDKPGVPWMITGATPAPTLTNGAVGVTAGAGHLQAALDSGVADIIMGVDYRVGSGPQLGGLAFRLTDANNHLVLLAYGNTLQLFRKQSGVYTLLASQPIAAVAAGSVHRIEVRTTGSAVQGWWDSALVLSATEAFQQTATRHGLDWNSAYDATVTFDNFAIRSALGPVVAPGVPGTPSPADAASDVATSARLTWSATNATSYDISFVSLSTTNPPPAAATGLTSASYTPALSAATTYLWQVVARGPGGSTTGPEWSFTTAAVPADLVIADTFTGANGTALSSHLPEVDKPGVPWAITGATPAPTLTNGAVGVTAGSGHLQAALNSGVADIIMGVDYRVGSGPQLGGLVFRLTDANNHLALLAYGNTLQLYRKQSGAYTLIASQPIAPVAAGSTHRIEVRTNGSTVQAWWDNALVISATETFQQTATRHGLDWNSAYDATVTFDNFAIRSALGPVAAPGVPGTPSPADAASDVATNPTLTWTAANATSYDVNFGTTNPPPAAAMNLPSASYTPAPSYMPALSAATTYFWQVVARGTGGATAGPVWSFTTGAAPVVPADLVIADTFTGANGTLLSSHVPEVDKPGVPWTITGATPAPTLTNGAVGVTAGAGHLQATLNSSLADIIMGVDYRVGSGPQLGGLAFRLTDANNHLVLLAYGNALQVYRKQNGTYTLLASQPIAAVAAGSTHRLEVSAVGSTLQGRWDGVPVVQATDTFQQTATRHGLDWNSAYDATVTFDNFAIRSALGPVLTPGAPSMPAPADAAIDVAMNATLTWSPTSATSYDINFGTSNPPPPAATGLPSASYTPALSAATTYFWQAIARGPGGATAGPVWSFTTAAAPAVPADLVIADTFIGANGTLLSSHLPEVDKPGVPWTITGATPAPTLTNGVVGVTAGSGHLQAALNSGLSDIIMGVDYRAGSGPQLGGLAFRLTDANNHLVLLAYGNALQVYRKQNGTYTLLASQPIPAVAAGSTHRLEVRAVGSTLQGRWDGALVVQATDTFQQTATRHGLDWNSAYDATVTFDNFEIRTVGAACADADNDRLCDAYETNTGVYVSPTNTGTNPNNPDTDGDGIKDGDEVLGTIDGLNLPAMGANPLKKNILLEYDWVDDNNDPTTCVAHSHRPTGPMLDRVAAAFAAAPLTNPDGTTGIVMLQDYGQGGAFSGGNALSHEGNVTGGVNGSDFQAIKAANFAANRRGYFHYVVMAHWYTSSLGSSGQAELPGNDLIVSLGCYASVTNVANTIMHELGHNLGLQHGGFESCNWKPNYNSVMNYRFQFSGADTSCNALGNNGEVNVLDYSRGTRIPLNENNLNENEGVCGSTAIDWNFNGIETGLVYDLNRASASPNASTAVDNSSCAAALTTLTDYNDWTHLSFTGLSDADGNLTFQTVSDCNNPDMPKSVPPELQQH